MPKGKGPQPNKKAVRTGNISASVSRGLVKAVKRDRTYLEGLVQKMSAHKKGKKVWVP